MVSRCPVMPSSFARDSEQSRRSPTCNLDWSGGVPDSELNSSPSFSSLVSVMPPQPGGSHGQCVHWQAPTGLSFCLKVQVGMSRYACRPRIMHMLGCLFCSRYLISRCCWSTIAALQIQHNQSPSGLVGLISVSMRGRASTRTAALTL